MREALRTRTRRPGPHALAVAVLLAGAPVALGADVVTNGGAEGDAGSEHSGQTVVPPSGWTTLEGGLSAQRYGHNGFPDGGGSGNNLFTGGASARSSARQVIDLSSGASRIDQGGHTATLSAKLGGFEAQGDHAFVTAEFLGAKGDRLDALTVGPVTRADRADRTTLLARTATGTIPYGTHSVAVTLTATREAGVSNDGYADDIVLELPLADRVAPERVIPRFLPSRNPTLRYTNASGAKLEPKIAIVRHGARVRFCNRTPVYRTPFLGIPKGALITVGTKEPTAVSVTIAPRRCVYFFARLLRPKGTYLRRLARLRTRGAAISRRQIAQAFDRRTGRLLAPRRRGKRGVCWRIFDRIDGDLVTAIYVLPQGRRRPLPADVRAARACRPGEPPGDL